MLMKLSRQKEEEDHRLQLQIQRQRAMRLSREIRLSMLEIVHPGVWHYQFLSIRLIG